MSMMMNGADKRGTNLGSAAFRKAYGVQLAYYSGSMYRGISSKELVVLMAKAGLMGFLGTGGLDLDRISADIDHIKSSLSEGGVYGVNVIADMTQPEKELDVIRLLLAKGVRNIETSAFMQITPALVLFRLSAIDGETGEALNNIIAKVSHPDVARQFMSPAPERILKSLVASNLLTSAQAEIGAKIPIARDVCVEADSGGHTDQGVAAVLLPTMQRLRDELGYSASEVRVGLGGGIGTPEAVASAFALGSDFVVTGSINQCTVEAGTSDAVKDLLQAINIQDTAYAPAGDMFEIGSKVQVLKRGVFFPSRANRLYMLYNQYDSLDDLPDKVRTQLEQKYFRKPLTEVWDETHQYLQSTGKTDIIDKANSNPKSKMALVFRWYFRYSMSLAFAGNVSEQVDFQVHTGPALGAFNQWVKGGEWENWRARHADQIAIRLMGDAEELLSKRTAHLTASQ